MVHSKTNRPALKASGARTVNKGRFVRVLLSQVMLTIALLVVARSQHILQVDSLTSPSVGKLLHVTFLIPPDPPTERGYPVLYLLHGYSGDHTNWTSLTRLQDYVRGTRLLVVMPEAENSWYVNSAERMDLRFEDFIVRDLPRFIAARFSVDTTKVAIAGLSMGGYGALVLSLRHPNMYKFSGSLSGAIVFPGEIAEMERQPSRQSLLPSLHQAFGRDEGERDRGYDLFDLVSTARDGSKTYFYLVAGIQDGFSTFLPAHRRFTDLLRSKNFQYEYHETNGGHNWRFWDREIQPLLRRMREVLEF